MDTEQVWTDPGKITSHNGESNMHENNSTVSIFSVKAISFSEGERDPLGFDDFAEKLGAEYLPFSGSVAKPAYFLFVAYVNYLLNGNNKQIPYNNSRQKREIQIKLEKLLVYSWKESNSNAKLRGEGILGNSFDIKDIDVFTSRGWIKQNAFKIYTEKNFCPKTLAQYLKSIGNRQIPFLKEFISKEYFKPNSRKDYLRDILNKLQKPNSIFNNHILENHIKEKFKIELLAKIRDMGKDQHYPKVEKLFGRAIVDADRYWETFLNTNKLPFSFLNEWFGKVVNAVDADLKNDNDNRLKLWTEANTAFEKIPKEYLSTPKYKEKLAIIPKPKNSWLKYENGRYTFDPLSSKLGKRKIEYLWESYKSRQGDKQNMRYFYNFRHYALLRLIKELQ